MSVLDHLLLSAGANLAALLSVALLRSAPPRLVVNVCLAGHVVMVGNPSGIVRRLEKLTNEPESREIPEGAGPYVRCVMNVVGGSDQPLPEGV